VKGNLEVYFNGWRATPEGLAIWPWRKLRHRWSELAKVSTTVRYDRQRYYQTIFVFRLGGSLTLRAMETFSRGSSLGRYAELLGFAIGGAPPNAEIDAITLGTAEWGTRAVEAELKRLPKSGISEADELRLAQHARARLHHKAALRAVEAALAIRPTNAEALQLRVDLLVDSGADVEKIAAAVERQVSARPGDVGPRRMMLLLDLQRNQREAGERAREWLEQSPEFEMAAAAAGYWLRREDYTAAAETWRRLRANATNEADREMAGGALEYVEKLGANRVFRAKERAKVWSRMALAWAPLALVLLVYGWRAYRAWYPEERKPSHEQAERMQEIVRQMEKTDREMRELTGLISGDDASLRKRADAGEAAAQYTIAFRILQRARKKPEDVALGVRYLEKAASQNYRFALLDLGERLNEGEGVPANPARAVELLTMAAELGSPRAARIVGEN
jgi:TPR repeat protein